MEAKESQKLVTAGPLAGRTKASVGFVLSHEQFPVTQLIDYGVSAERAGFDAIWTSDHFQPWQDNEGHAGFAWVTLAALGQKMTRIPLGTGVTCPTYRYHPSIVAEAFASLGLLYPGRVFLGVGSGEALNEVAAGGGWGDYKERSGRLIEAVELIKQLWTGQLVTFKGDYYQVENARLYDVPEQPIPIYIAATGPKSMRLAGQYGDGLITDPERAMKPELKAAFEEGARAAGKDPAQMPIIVESFVTVGTEAEARKYAPLWQFLPNAWSKYFSDPDPRSIQKRAEADVPIEDLLKMWTVGQDAQTHIKKLQELIDSGLKHVFIHSAQPDQRAVIDFYGKEVLPHIKGR